MIFTTDHRWQGAPCVPRVPREFTDALDVLAWIHQFVRQIPRAVCTVCGLPYRAGYAHPCCVADVVAHDVEVARALEIVRRFKHTIAAYRTRPDRRARRLAEIHLFARWQ